MQLCGLCDYPICDYAGSTVLQRLSTLLSLHIKNDIDISKVSAVKIGKSHRYFGLFCTKSYAPILKGVDSLCNLRAYMYCIASLFGTRHVHRI